MEWIWIDLKIACMLLAWILAVYGYGFATLAILSKCIKCDFLQDIALKLIVAMILGVLVLSFIVQVLNFFIAIFPIISIATLVIGVALFAYFCKDLLHNPKIWISGFLSFFIVVLLSFLSDSMGDSVNYHIQIVTWIQQSPVIFGLGNIHGRLGFNGIIYNFYALTDVSQIFTHLRSFIGNEIVYFGLLLSAFYIFITQKAPKIYHFFILCSLLSFTFIIKHGEFRGLYCEGMGAVFGVAVFALLLKILEDSTTLDSQTTQNNGLFILAFIIALFATLVKIANFGLILAVILCFVYVYRSRILHKKFLKQHLKPCLYLGIFSLIFVFPWALKGMMTSGMIAYPASIGYIETLPWAVSNAQRENEVCWIMSWARAPMKNCVEVLSDSAWLKDWLMMKTRYFGYFKYFVFAFFASLGLFVALRFCLKSARLSDRFYALDYKIFYVTFICIFVGVLFWFLSGPDPRFGMVYIIPLLALVFAFNLLMIKSLTRYKKLMSVLFFLCVALIFLKVRDVFVLFWAILLLVSFKDTQDSKYYRKFITIFVAFTLVCTINLYRRSFGEFKENPKIRVVYVEEKMSDFGVKIYTRVDEPNERTQSIYYEALPMTPYFNAKIKEESILGRKAYINTAKEKESK